jgi:uridine kinase
VTREREQVLHAVAAVIEPGMRVGIDGVSAAGKTTFADELASFVDAPVLRASFDDFHRPRAERYARGEGPDSYYEDTFDAAAFRRELLDPFARGEPIRTAIFDDVHDVSIKGSPTPVPAGAVLVVDGVWLHKPELRDGFDLTVWLEADRKIALARAIERDGLRERYLNRYYPGETRYLEEVEPARLADLVVDTTDPSHPRLVIDSTP